MKKIFVIFFASLFSLGFIAQNAMAVKPSGEEMVVGVFIGSEPVPPIPLTAKDIDKIVAKERQKTVKNVKKIFDAKDTKTAVAIDNLVGVNRGVTVALDNLDKRVAKLNTSKVVGAVTHTKWLLVGVMIVGFIILALLILRNGSSIHAVGTTLDRVEQKVAEAPAETAKLVKQLGPITISVKVERRKITYIPEIVDNMYLTLYVPKSADHSVPDSEIARVRKRDPEDVHNSTRDVMKLYCSPGCPDLQKRLIDYLKGTPTLKIEELIAA